MILCVGAASRRVVEEAAKLGVHQIVASRRQVGEFTAGYTGFTSETFASEVRALSSGRTNVVRDHGGPYQNGDKNDNWAMAFDADVAAGFDVLHLDVCKLPLYDQVAELKRLCRKFDGQAILEIGGERDPQSWLDTLLDAVTGEVRISTAVADLGGYIWADRQRGHLASLGKVQEIVSAYAAKGIVTKAHNLDWAGARTDYGKVAALYNVAPEFGNVEVDAWLRLLPSYRVRHLLAFAYASDVWKRWFGDGEGTYFERARCALRYHLETPEVRAILDEYNDIEVREAISDALKHG